MAAQPQAPAASGPTEAPSDPTRSRRWVIAAAVVAVVAALTVAIVLGMRGGGGDDVQTGAVVQPVQATVFADGADADHPERADRAIDGDPDTGWTTDVYTDAVPFPTFKTGVGLILQLPSPTKVGTVSVRVPSTGTAVEIRSADSAKPSSLADTTKLAGPVTLQPGDNTITVDADEPTSYLLVWISTLGATDGRSRTELSEIVVHAAK